MASDKKSNENNIPWADLSRSERKKMATRESLLLAFQELMLEGDLESITVNHITEKADVGLGTFYNYFKSKTEILDGLFELALDFYNKELDQITETLDDPAEILAASIIFTITKISDVEQFGWLLFDVGLPRDLMRQKVYLRAAQDFAKGISTQRFKTDDVQLTLTMMDGSVMAVAEAIYRKELPKKSTQKVAEFALRQLGVPDDEAHNAAFKKYKKIKLSGFPLKLSEL